jgi:nucleoside recognition membrane protein YjiH
MNKQTYSFQNYLKFLIPSFIGIFLFIVPVTYQEELTIPVAMMAQIVQDTLGHSLPGITTALMVLSAALTVFIKLLKPAAAQKSGFIKTLFNVSPVWTAARILGAFFAVLALTAVGPEMVTSENTGGLLLYDLIPVLFSVFLFAGLLLPLLMNFGLLEFCGALFIKFMRPVFTLPGRSSIDCLASWLGDGTVGVLLTSKQYEEGYYTKREAAVIGTTFSVVSITFSIVILAQMKLEHLILPYYLTIVIAGLAAAVISPRIPPLSRKPDTFYEHAKNPSSDEAIPAGYTPFRWGLKQAVEAAQKGKSIGGFLKEGFHNVLDLWLGVIPIVMALGTLALMTAEYTPLFQWLGAPFIPLLTLLQVPEAAQAAQTMVIGFADMFLPSVIGMEIENDMTRFIIACVSVTQLIYMSEVGGLLLGSKIPVSFLDLVIIFIQRTLITLPIIVLMANFIF